MCTSRLENPMDKNTPKDQFLQVGQPPQNHPIYIQKLAIWI